MNVIFFGCKRAYHACLRLTRRSLTRLGLTAARFDMLTAIRRHPYGVVQSKLREMLGVSAATISRMLGSLEELGLVRRRRTDNDQRQRHVTLTNLGESRMRRATTVLIGSGVVQLAFDSALTDGHGYSETLTFLATDEADTVLTHLRQGFRDVATLYYPWHPDD